MKFKRIAGKKGEIKSKIDGSLISTCDNDITNHSVSIVYGAITNKPCLLRFSRNSGVAHAYQHMRVVMPWHKNQLVLIIKFSITSLLQV